MFVRKVGDDNIQDFWREEYARKPAPPNLKPTGSSVRVTAVMTYHFGLTWWGDVAWRGGAARGFGQCRMETLLLRDDKLTE